MKRRDILTLGSAGAFAVAMGACTADVKTQSNVDRSYGRKLDRLLVSLNLTFEYAPGVVRKNDVTYLKTDEVLDSLRAAFAGTSVTTEYVTDQSTLAAVAASFRPTQILSIRVTSFTTDMGSAAAFTLICEVRDAGTQKRIWLSTIAFQQSETAGTRLLRAASKKAADNFANNLVGKLREDGLV